MSDTLKTIHNRHSIRRFLHKEIPKDHIHTILDAANQAPSAHNQQSWKFIIVEGNRKQGLADLVSEASKSFERPSNSLLRMAGRSIQSAPTVIAIANTGELVEHGSELFKVNSPEGIDFFRTMEIQSSAAAVENMLLAATSLGLGTVWLGILFLIKDQVLQFLNEPAGEFMAVVPVGYPARTTKGPRKKPLDNVVKAL